MKYKFTSRDWINIIAMVGICILAFGLYSIAFHAQVSELPVVPEIGEITDVEDDLQITMVNTGHKPINLAEAVQIDILEDTKRLEIMHVEPPKYASSKPTEPEPTEEPVEPEPEIDISEDMVEMLAIVIYQEVGSDSICQSCRYRVGDIVLNRVADSRYPDTIYGVLTEPYQYGRLAWTGVVWADRASNPYEAHAVERARAVARDILSGNHSELYGNGYIYQAAHVQGTGGFWCCGHYFAKG